MRTVITGGTGTRSNPGGSVPVIGKTGTTDGEVQTWMVGSSTEVATAVWVGNIVGDYRIGRLSNGNGLRHDIFRIIMQEANEQYGGEAFPAPPTRLVQGSGISVPDITGLTLEEAIVLIESLGLRLEVTAGAPAGRISGFQPVAGTLLARGMTVRVSTGDGGGDSGSTGNLIMPNLVGVSVQQANAAMDGLGMTGPRAFSCGPGSVSSDTSSGVIMSQSMGGGTLVWNYVAVNFEVSCGSAPPSNDEFLD
jgi:membrane peptidoglycan carboxypeptidase